MKALIRYGQDRDQPMSVLDAVIQTNKDQPGRMIDMLRKHHSDFSGLKVAVLGLAFKPGTDDIRESASIRVVRDLLDEGAVITAFDPIAQEETEKELGAGAIAYAKSLEACIADKDAILLMTSWPEFRDLPALIEKLPSKPLLIDGRRMIERSSVSRYEGIGIS